MERSRGQARRRRPAAAELETGRDLKLRGIEKVLKNERAEWRRRALDCVLAVADTLVFFHVNHVRDHADRIGLGPPHHPNVWGAVMKSAIALGIMTPTGDHVIGKRKAQHARKIQLYRRTEKETT
jgi:hypothetical protein